MSYNWVDQNPVHSPPGRYVNAIDYNPNTGRTVMFGGATGFGGPTSFNDVWYWENGDWTQAFPTGTLPVARSYHKFVYDPIRDEFITFGGLNNAGSVIGGTWALAGDLSVWTQKTPATNPAARYGYMMAYHPGSSSIILVGGNSGFGDIFETWRWTGTNWVLLSPANAPNSSFHFYSMFGRGFGLDPTSGKMVLTHQQWEFSSPSSFIVQSYFDGTDWTAINSFAAIMIGSFQFGAVPNMAVHNNLGRALLAGGTGSAPGESTSTLQPYPSHTWDQLYMPLVSDALKDTQFPAIAPEVHGDVLSFSRDPFGVQKTLIFKLVSNAGQIYRRS